jgi:hypothetical protein
MAPSWVSWLVRGGEPGKKSFNRMSREIKPVPAEANGKAPNGHSTNNGIGEYFDAAKDQQQNKQLASAVKNVYLLERGYTEVAR